MKMMELRIKALDEDAFESAESNGYVYSTCTRYIDDRLKTIHVFVDLGKEVISYFQSGCGADCYTFLLDDD